MTDPIQTSAEALEADALPRAHSVRADQDGPGDETLANAARGTAKSPAEWAYQRLILYIQNFEKDLDEDHEVAMGFVGGASGIMRIEGVGFFDPDIVTFYGSDPTGARTQLIQHVTQLNVLLRTLPKAVPTEAPRRIGFRLAQDIDPEEAT